MVSRESPVGRRVVLASPTSQTEQRAVESTEALEMKMPAFYRRGHFLPNPTWVGRLISTDASQIGVRGRFG